MFLNNVYKYSYLCKQIHIDKLSKLYDYLINILYKYLNLKKYS